MSTRFPSDEWAKALRDELNRSSTYAEVAQTWEGAINFVIEDVLDSDGKPIALWVDLWHGQCRDAKQVDPSAPIEAPYTIQAPLAKWKKVIGKQIDPIQAMVNDQLRVKGNMVQLLKYTKAAQELVECATRVPTDFPVEPTSLGGPGGNRHA